MEAAEEVNDMALDLKSLKLPSNLPINTKFLLVLVIGFSAIIYVYIKYSYNPKKKEIEDLHQQLIDLKNDYAALQVQVQNLQETKRKLDSLKVIWSRIQVLLPDKKDIPGWFDDIVAASRSAGIDVMQFKPAPPKQSDKYTEYPFDVTFRGTYHSFGAYLAAIANHPRITRVSDVKLSSMDRQEGEPWTLQGSMTISTFVFNPGFLEKQQQQQKGKAGSGQKR